MLNASLPDIAGILRDFGLSQEIGRISELQRYDYEDRNPGAKHVRLIVKAEPVSGPPLVVRNLYQAASGEIGVFDFNRCGDNNLFCDAVMQAVFEARLMD